MDRTDKTAWRLGCIGLAASAAILGLVSCAGREQNSAMTSTASSATTAAASETRTETAAAETDSNLQSKLIDLPMPPGSTVKQEKGLHGGDLETWRTPNSVSSEISRLKELLPVDKPLNGIAWCKTSYDPGIPGQDSEVAGWTWANSDEWISVTATTSRAFAEPGDDWTTLPSQVVIVHQHSNEGC